jgi:tRNA dimethylallyltransferase
MQLYRGLDIATAKPTTAEQARARHHLIDILEPGESYSAQQWAADARLAIAEIAARGRRPLLVGGTGFYLRALLQPSTLAEAPPDPALRAALTEEAIRKGAAALHARLAQTDSDAAARLHPHDIHRVIRAIEVARYRSAAEGSTPASPEPQSAPPSVIFGLTMSREQLVSRLEARIDAMLAAGFMDELRRLAELGLPPGSGVLQAVGYRQMLPVLTDPTRFDAGIELWKRDTRRYAKRQMTWFRNQLNAHWIEIDSTSAPSDVAATIAVALQQP